MVNVLPVPVWPYAKMVPDINNKSINLNITEGFITTSLKFNGYKVSVKVSYTQSYNDDGV